MPFLSYPVAYLEVASCQGDHAMSFLCYPATYLEVASLVRSVWGTKDCHLPGVEILILYGDQETLHWFSLKSLELHTQRSHGCG